MRNAKINSIRRMSKQYTKKAKVHNRVYLFFLILRQGSVELQCLVGLQTVLLECSPNGTICSSPVDVCSSKSCDSFSVRSSDSSPCRFRLLPVCSRPKSWLAAPTALFVVASSVLGCLCLAFYSRSTEGYVCA